MILSDRDIKERELENNTEGLRVFHDSFGVSDLGPCSIDLRLSKVLRVFKRLTLWERLVNKVCEKVGVSNGFYLDMFTGNLENATKEKVIPVGGYLLKPGEFLLGSTVSKVQIPDDLTGIVMGRSTIARMGIVIHFAGLIDSGFKGTITLEIANVGKIPVMIHRNMKICQLVLLQNKSVCDTPYGKKEGSKYQGQSGVTEARTEILR